MAVVIDQKEYLKKYLSADSKKDKSKKKKKKAFIKDRVKIIDDDLDMSTSHTIRANDLEEFLTAEDAPQVVGVIDDRPLALRIDDYRKSDKWILVGSDDEDCKNVTIKQEVVDDSSPPPSRNKISIRMRDASPARRIKEEDISPPRKTRRRDSDASPPRRRASPVHKKDDDISPPRRRAKSPSSDASPVRRRKDDDISPPRRRRHSDASPPRRPKTPDSDASPPRRTKHSDSPPRRTKSRWNSEASPPRQKAKMTKTLDGKVAGLQNAKDLKVETTAFRKREDDLFKAMSEDVSGRNAAPIMRDRKTGKVRNFEAEAAKEQEKQKRINEQKEKYDKWGKGLKQVEEYNDKLRSDLHEMSKPLARYADDDDLEKFLMEQERDGDPMLEYMRKKKKKKAIASGKPLKPVYEGEFMPNRYAIPPGHRWDGVDRSNGYEKSWFAKQNAKKAVEEEVYKWSTEDM